MLPIYSLEGVEKVMDYHTKMVDALLMLPHISQLETITLLSRRGWTFHEFSTILFDLTISEKEFHNYNALRSLFLASQKERREKVLYRLDRSSYEDYITFLTAQVLQPFPSPLSAFLLNDED